MLKTSYNMNGIILVSPIAIYQQARLSDGTATNSLLHLFYTLFTPEVSTLELKTTLPNMGKDNFTIYKSVI